MTKLYKLFKLSYRERHLLLVTYSLLNIVRLGLWLLPFLRLRSYLDNLSTDKPITRQQVPIAQIVWAVDTSSQYSPGQPKCLARALTTQVLMRRQGHSSALKIGVMKGTQGQFEAHAWVEKEGDVVIGRLANLGSFVPLSNVSPNVSR